jgi:hypothetical protein
MGVFMDQHERMDVLRIASNLTSLPSDPDNVMRHAKVLVDWLDQAPTGGDRRARLAGLERANYNRQDRRSADGKRVGPQDDPGILIAEAKTYYEFLKGV